MPTNSGDTIRVIIVDSIAETRRNVHALLSPVSDIEVVGTARSGQEGIQLAQAVKPDVALISPSFEDMDSLQTIRTLIADQPDLRLILISTTSNLEYLQQARQIGVKSFLPQPPSADKLVEAIRKA